MLGDFARDGSSGDREDAGQPDGVAGSGSAASSSRSAALLAILPEAGDPRDARLALARAALGAAGARAPRLRLPREPSRHPLAARGPAAAAFALTSFDGAELPLADLRGKVVVLNFWASWCYPACYEEAPALERGWQAYRDRGVMVVGVDIQDKPEAARKFIDDFGLTFPNAPDPAARSRSTTACTACPRRSSSTRGPHPRQARGAITDQMFSEAIEPLLSRPGPRSERRSAGEARARRRRRARAVLIVAAAVAPARRPGGRRPPRRSASRTSTRSRRSCAAWCARTSRWPTRRPRWPARCARSCASGSPPATRRVRSISISSTATANGSCWRLRGADSRSSGVAGPARGRRGGLVLVAILMRRLDTRARAPDAARRSTPR